MENKGEENGFWEVSWLGDLEEREMAFLAGRERERAGIGRGKRGKA